jgi:TusE/DsrC/DsvC family sulfur relay protein
MMVESQTISTEPDISSARKDDRKKELRNWDREQARRIAAEEGVQMTSEHWEVIRFLRSYYLEHGKADSGREIANAMDKAFADLGGRRYLHKLFPEGPVAQGSRIADIPIPAFTRDPSFGSTL